MQSVRWISRPASSQPRLNRLSSTAFIVLPWPTNSTGIFVSRLSNAAIARLTPVKPAIVTVPADRAARNVRRRMAQRVADRDGRERELPGCRWHPDAAIDERERIGQRHVEISRIDAEI